jgi:hypothetical protein
MRITKVRDAEAHSTDYFIRVFGKTLLIQHTDNGWSGR